MKCEGM